MSDTSTFLRTYSAGSMRWTFRKKALQGAMEIGHVPIVIQLLSCAFFHYSYLSDNIPNIKFIPKEEL